MIGDDLTPFFVPGEFAGEDTLDGQPVVGIFDAAYVSTNDGIGMASSRPAYLLPAAAAPASGSSWPRRSLTAPALPC
jgi:hypothetical protein